MKNFSRLFLFITILGLFFASESSAQMQFDASSIKVSPQYPKAGEEVTVTIEDYANNINSQTITWTVNGSQVQSGIGLKSYTFTVGKLGASHNVSARTNVKTYNVVIRPSEVDVIWQANSYTPPFYKGKALFPNSGTITVSAIPHIYTSNGSRIDPKTLTYKWKKGGGAVPDQSGYGRDSMNVVGSLISRPTTYEVEVTNSDGTYKGYGSARVEEVTPTVYIYENDPLFGVEYERALNDSVVPLDGDEVELVAVPYFFSTNQSLDKINMSWRMNSSLVASDTDSIVLRKSGLVGTSAINLEARHTDNFMQLSRVKTSISISGN